MMEFSGPVTVATRQNYSSMIAFAFALPAGGGVYTRTVMRGESSRR
jgi:hypothetical protein